MVNYNPASTSKLVESAANDDQENGHYLQSGTQSVGQDSECSNNNGNNKDDDFQSSSAINSDFDNNDNHQPDELCDIKEQ